MHSDRGMATENVAAGSDGPELGFRMGSGGGDEVREQTRRLMAGEGTRLLSRGHAVLQPQQQAEKSRKSSLAPLSHVLQKRFKDRTSLGTIPAHSSLLLISPAAPRMMNWSGLIWLCRNYYFPE